MFIILGITVSYLFSSPAYAAVGSVSGRVVTGPTQSGVANVWIKWVGPRDYYAPKTNQTAEQRREIAEKWPHDGEGGAIRYTKTDSNGNFRFGSWFIINENSSDNYTKEPFSVPSGIERAKQYLTWIKPDEPETPPDTTAAKALEQFMSGYSYGPTNFISDTPPSQATLDLIKAINEADKYRPQGSGWVRLSNRTDFDGGFQCDSPPTFTVVKPKNFSGFITNDGQKAADWNNGWTPIVLSEPFILNSTGPTGFLDGDGTFAGTGNLNSCSVYGWTKDLSSEQKYDVEVFIGGPAGSGAPSIKSKADKPRGDSLSGFGFDIKLPEQYQDGIRKDIYVYAVDTNGTRVPLAQTPRSLVCGATTATPSTPPTSPSPRQPEGTVNIPLTPVVDIWGESGVRVTGRGSQGGTLNVDFKQPFTLFWTASNSSTCIASGNWAGVKQAGTARLSKRVDTTEPSKTYIYTLTCFNNTSGNQESDTILVSVGSDTREPFLQTTEGDVHSNKEIDLPKPQP